MVDRYLISRLDGAVKDNGGNWVSYDDYESLQTQVKIKEGQLLTALKAHEQSQSRNREFEEALTDIRNFEPTPHIGRRRTFTNWQHAFYTLQSMAKKVLPQTSEQEGSGD